MSKLRRTLLCCAAALALAGCRGCSERPQPPPKGERGPSGLATIAEPANTRLQELWRDAGEGVKIEPAEPGEEMVRYLPSRACKLSYQLRYLQLSEVAAGRKPTGNELTAQLSAEAVPEAKRSVRWSVSSTSVARIIEGALSAAQRGATQVGAVVSSDGAQWLEVDGPHLLWSVFTTQPPLELTHPLLPASPRVGFQGVWQQRYFPLAAAKRLIARRNARRGRKTPNAQPLSRPVEVAVGGWITMTGSAVAPSGSAMAAPSGSAAAAPSSSTTPSPSAAPSATARVAGGPERAAVIVASWVVEDVTDTPLPHERLERYKARYVISERGHVVHAIVLGRARHWWSPRPGESNEKRSINEYELRLLDSCGGVSMRPARPGGRLTID